jgi:hypothetical protein
VQSCYEVSFVFSHPLCSSTYPVLCCVLFSDAGCVALRFLRSYTVNGEQLSFGYFPETTTRDEPIDDQPGELNIYCAIKDAHGGEVGEETDFHISECYQ